MRGNQQPSGNVSIAMRKVLQALVLVLAVAGCATTAGGDASERLIRSHTDRGTGGMGAIVNGVVEIDIDVGCVWLSTPDGVRHPVVWPVGTEADGDPLVITLPDGQTVRHGDLVSGGGGYIGASAATSGMEPFPPECVQDGEAAVFNPGSEIQVLADVGVEISPTLLGRFSVPEPIGLELIAVNPNERSVAIADFVTGTVHVYEPSDYEGPLDGIDGASGGGGFIHVWSQGTVYSYPGRLTDEPLVYQPENLRKIEGVAPSLEVLPAPDGEHTWLVQDGAGSGPTLVELVNLVEAQVTRLSRVEVEGSWQPYGSTTAGLILVSNEGPVRTRLVAMDGSVGEPVDGEPISVGWSGVLILEDDALRVTAPDLTEPVHVVPPTGGTWTSVGGPVIPTDAPPIRTGAGAHLVALADGDGAGPRALVVVRADGSARVIHEMETGQGVAMFSRADDWIAVVGPGGVTLIPSGGDPVSLGEILPSEHWVLTAG